MSWWPRSCSKRDVRCKTATSPSAPRSSPRRTASTPSPKRCRWATAASTARSFSRRGASSRSAPSSSTCRSKRTQPLSREDCEASIRSGGKGTEASLKGFAAGFDAAAGGKADMTPEEGRRLRGSPAERLRPIFPEETHAILREGVARCADFQGREYANVYLDRIEPIANLDRAADGYKLTIETGRFLALWMCYEDVIRVADLKTRRSRFERVREELRAKPHEPVHIVEFLKPGVDEFTAVLPRFLARPLKAFAGASGLADKLNIGLHVKTTSVSGFLALRFLAWLRPLRPLTSRWHEEQSLIDRWLVAIATAAKRDAGRARQRLPTRKGASSSCPWRRTASRRCPPGRSQ